MTEKDTSISGFHGTFASVADDIIDNGFTYKFSDKHWLGQGIYFYDNFELALWWIERKVIYEKEKNNRTEEPSVINANIIADKDKIINLDNPKDMDRYIDFIEGFIKEMKKNGLNIKLKKGDNFKRQNQCFMLDMMKKSENIEVVLETFVKRRSSYGKYDLKKFEDEYYQFDLSYKETQICASNNNTIHNKDIVYP